MAAVAVFLVCFLFCFGVAVVGVLCLYFCSVDVIGT